MGLFHKPSLLSVVPSEVTGAVTMLFRSVYRREVY